MRKSLKSCDVRFDAAVTFKIPQKPFVLLGARGSDGLDGVCKLRTALACALADHGFRPLRGYEPHMTLCYDRHLPVDWLDIDSISFQVDEFVVTQ